VTFLAIVLIFRLTSLTRKPWLWQYIVITIWLLLFCLCRLLASSRQGVVCPGPPILHKLGDASRLQQIQPPQHLYVPPSRSSRSVSHRCRILPTRKKCTCPHRSSVHSPSAAFCPLRMASYLSDNTSAVPRCREYEKGKGGRVWEESGDCLPLLAGHIPSVTHPEKTPVVFFSSLHNPEHASYPTFARGRKSRV
jgi:hypothetical protein